MSLSGNQFEPVVADVNTTTTSNTTTTATATSTTLATADTDTLLVVSPSSGLAVTIFVCVMSGLAVLLIIVGIWVGSRESVAYKSINYRK